MSATRVNLSVTTDDQTIATRAVEALTRAALGLALEGVPVFLMLGPDEEGDE